jgi:hypothetical protein
MLSRFEKMSLTELKKEKEKIVRTYIGEFYKQEQYGKDLIEIALLIKEKE